MRKRLTLTFLLLILLIPPTYSSFKAYGFRRHPRPSQAGGFFASVFPHTVPACLLLLERGTPAYDQDLRAWIYQSGIVRDNFWNRWMLRRDALDLRPNEFYLLARYPVSPDPALLPKIREALLAGEWSALALLRRIDDQRAGELFRDWAEQSLTGPADTDAFLDSLPYMVGWPSVPLTGLLQRFWPQLSEEQRATALGTIARFLGESVAPEDLLTFLDQALERQEVRADGFALAVLGHFLAGPATQERVLALLEREAPRIDLVAVENIVTGLPPEDVFFSDETEEEPEEAEEENEEEPSLPLPPPLPGDSEEPVEPEAPSPLSQGRQAENASLVFRRMAQEYQSVAVEALHALAHLDVSLAEKMAQLILAGVDSELRKGVIVILTGHGSDLGQRYLDQAFKGDTPRRTSFSSVFDYIEGSHAVEQYVRIARHDYLEVGKSWPPAVRDPRQWEEEARLWPAFISEFPWFPGSDDAYYRLAYARYADGGPEEAVATVLEYFRRFGESHPDGDAEPYLRYLLRITAYGNPDLPAHADLFAHLRALLDYPPGLFLLEEDFDITPYWSALEWFRLREAERRSLGASLEDLAYLRELVAVARLPYGAVRLRQAAEVLKKEDASVTGLLYGSFPWLDEVQRAEGSVEFAGESMREAADRLGWQLEKATTEGDVELCLALISWIAAHEEFRVYESEGEVFTPLFQQVEQARTTGTLCPSMSEPAE